MTPSHPPHSSGRAIFLTTLLLAFVGLLLAGFFILLIGPGFFGVLGVLALIGAVHYLLWGRSMDQEVEQQTEEDPPPETNGWSGDRPRRF